MSRSFIFILLFSFIEALAGPVHMTYQGRLFDSSGDPVENGTVSIVTQVMDPLADCLLYEETHSVDMSQSSGFFSIQIGAGTQNTSTAPNFTLSESLSNAAAFNDVLLGCTGDSYTPGATDKRILRVSIDGNTLNPDQPINSTPYSLFANEATNLGGKPLSQVESEYQSYADSNWAGTPLPDIQSTPLTAGDSFKWDGTKWIVFQPGSATGLTDVLGGTGLTDTGTTTKTLNIGAGNGITVNADDIAVDAGDGLQFNSGALEVNLGAGLQINAGAIEVNQSAINYSSISGTPAAATTLVDGLMSSGDKSKLDNIAANAEVNVNADWNASSGDAQIMNKPAIPSNITDLTVGNDSISGNAVNGGTISSFASTGIDDNAAATAMTIDGSGNVGLGTTTPDISALLDISSSTKGFLPPRMTRAERDAIGSPVVGLQIYNTTDKKLNLYDGSAWDEVGGESNNGLSPKSIYQWPSAVPELASAPASPTIGDAYYDTTDNKLFVYSSATWLEVDNSDGTIKYCTENDNCTGTVKFCRVTTPDTNVVVQTPTYDLLFGSWSNSQCGISGSGWHVGGSGVSSCSTGAGTKHGRCLWVLVDDPGLSSVKTIISDTDDDTMVQAEESADEDIIRFDTDGSERMVINASGNVGIGTTSPTEKLDVAGCIKHNNGTLGSSCSSDRRLKKDIEDNIYEDALDKISLLRPRKYRYLRGNQNIYLGVIAQELQEIAPELVMTKDDGYLAVDYEGLKWMSYEAIAELNRKLREESAAKDRKIESLENSLKALLERVEKLEAKNP